MDPFTARMLERARDRQRRVDERTGAASAAPTPARSPLRTTSAAPDTSPLRGGGSGGDLTDLGAARQAVKSASPRRAAEDKENHPNVLHASTRSRLKQLSSLYSTDGETDLDACDAMVTPRQSCLAHEPSPPPAAPPASSGSSRSLRGRLANLASQYQDIESEEAQGFTPSGSGTRLVYDFSDRSRSPSPPRVVGAVAKPSPERSAAPAPYRSVSPVRYSPPPRPQGSPSTGQYDARARQWSPTRQGSPTRQPPPARQGSPTRQPSPVRGRLVQERAAVFDRPASPPPTGVDPTEMPLSDRRKLFEKGQPPKVIARFGTPVTPQMLRQHSQQPAAEPVRCRSPVRQPAPPPVEQSSEGPPSSSRNVGESTFQAHRKLWESMNNDWRNNEIAQNSREQRERELGFLANRWQHKPAEREQAAREAKTLEQMAPPPQPAGIPSPPPPPPPPAPADSPHHRPCPQSPVHQPAAVNSPVHQSEPAPDFRATGGVSGRASPAGTACRAADESLTSHASGQSDAESLGAEILAMARANQQPQPGLPTIDESATDSSSDLSGMAACAAIDDVLDIMDDEEDEEEPTPPKRTRTAPLRRCTSQPAPAPASASPSVAQLIGRFQRSPPRPAPRHRLSAPCLPARPTAGRTSAGARPRAVHTSTPRDARPAASFDGPTLELSLSAADLTPELADSGSRSRSATESAGTGDAADRSSRGVHSRLGRYLFGEWPHDVGLTPSAGSPWTERARGGGSGGVERGAGEGGGGSERRTSSVSDLVARMEAVCLRRGGGDSGPGTRADSSSSDADLKRQDSGVFRVPMASVKSPERDPNLPSVVVDGDAELPLMHSVSFYRRQRPQEVRVTPVKPVVRNREVARYPAQEASSSGQEALGASVQERIKQLQKEATQQLNVMSQASRALNLCNSTVEFTGSAEMVEAERLLLVATHRRQAALSEVQRLKTEGAMRQQGIVRPASRGSLSVSSITLPLKTSFVREVAAGSASHVYFFVALLRYRGQVIATQMLSSEDSIKGNAINFPNLVSFRDLEADFGVALEVYSLQAPRELLPHDAKYHIRKDRVKTPKKLLKQQSSLTSPAVQSPAGPGAVRATSFQLMGFVHLTARNLNNNAWALDKVPSQSPLDGGVYMQVTCHADCAVEERGFVTVFDDVSGFGAWHRRWCALAGGRLSFWKYPEDEQRLPASAEVDLRRCVTERVGAVPRDICARQNTLLLVTVRQARPDDADSLVMQRRGAMTRIRHLLSLDTRDERQLWADQLNEALENIRAWDPDAMQPHLDPSA